MTVLSADAYQAPSRGAASITRDSLVPWSAVVVALTLLTLIPVSRQVFAGDFGDPDDAMRLVEVRAWLHGQTWFDVSAHRLDPALGASMHWSRLVDLPPALLIALFGLVVDSATAEALARILVPTSLLALLYVGMARLAAVLVGRDAQGPALLGTALSGAALVLFVPGRIGHHAPETVALVFAVAVVLEAVDPARARRAAVAGGLVALALSMSLETMPFLGVLSACLVAIWIAQGAAVAAALGWFAAGLGVALPVVFLATVAPDHWFAPACDAYGAAHFGAGMIAAVGVFALSRTNASSTAVRALAATAVGAAVLTFVAFAYPACLHSPFAGVDPLVRAVWLDNVGESRPLIWLFRHRPMLGLALLAPVVLGLLTCLLAACRRRGTDRVRFAVVAALVAAGIALGCVQVRVFSSTTPLALCGGLYAVTAFRDWLGSRGFALAGGLAWVAILPFTGTAWSLLPDDRVDGPVRESCLTAAAIAPLATLPPGRVVAPINLGSHILVGTPLDVFAAPYHRDNDGNRFELDTFLASPVQAAVLLAGRHVAYVATCPGLGELDALAARAPDSLAAALYAGTVPAYLTPLPLAGTPIRVYAVRK